MKQKLNRVLAILLVLSLAVFPVFAEGNGTAAITPQGRAMAGKTVKLTVSLAEMPAYDDLGIEFTYDDAKLTLEGGQWLPEGGLADVDTGSGLAVWTGNRVEAVNGDVFTAEFRLNESVTPETEITVSCTVTARAKGSLVASLNASTPVTVSTYIPGDINNDRKVNNQDLTVLFQHLSGWDVPVNENALDVSGDGKVNNQDLTILFQYLSGWDVVIH